MFGVRGNKERGKLITKEGLAKTGQRLLEHSEQVHGVKYSLHRCSVFGVIKKGQIGH